MTTLGHLLMLRPIKRSFLGAGQVSQVRQANVRPSDAIQITVSNNLKNGLFRLAIVQAITNRIGQSVHRVFLQGCENSSRDFPSGGAAEIPKNSIQSLSRGLNRSSRLRWQKIGVPIQINFENFAAGGGSALKRLGNQFQNYWACSLRV